MRHSISHKALRHSPRWNTCLQLWSGSGQRHSLVNADDPAVWALSTVLLTSVSSFLCTWVFSHVSYLLMDFRALCLVRPLPVSLQSFKHTLCFCQIGPFFSLPIFVFIKFSSYLKWKNTLSFCNVISSWYSSRLNSVAIWKKKAFSEMVLWFLPLKNIITAFFSCVS